jgi:hypothetical protein
MNCAGCKHWQSEIVSTDRGRKVFPPGCIKFEDTADCCGREVEHYDEAEEEEK